MSKLFESIKLRDVTIRNRIVLSPMSQYSAGNGIANDWHLAHLARFALGGFGVVMMEATSVSPEGRITPGDVGIWNDAQTIPLAHIASFLSAYGAAPGIQLAHAGRKASCQRPWHGNAPLNEQDAIARAEAAWPIVAPSAIAYSDKDPKPIELDENGIQRILDAFVSAAKRAEHAGFAIAEVHCAHGYLLHEFLSPISNKRTDQYGGSLENRMKFPLDVISAVRSVWPDSKPLFVRISAIDAVQDGWSIDDSIVFAKKLKTIGVDIVDCSSGGISPKYDAPSGPGYQVPYASKVSKEAEIGTMAVGLITDAHQAEEIVAQGHASLVALGREALNNPQWPLHAQHTLEGNLLNYDMWPVQSGYWLKNRAKQTK